MERPIAFNMMLLALAVTVSACSGKESASAAPSPAAPSKMSANCDMQGMDMSKMSAEEHQKMMENCPKK